MNVYTWPSTVNTRFFSGNDKPKANTETVSYLSGRQVSYQINTKKLMTFKVKLKVTKAELALFWTWYNDVLGQNAKCLHLYSSRKQRLPFCFYSRPRRYGSDNPRSFNGN